eukprot:COSAG02_NODE_3366_length_6865_cov_21.795300_3_plen_231_part_00
MWAVWLQQQYVVVLVVAGGAKAAASAVVVSADSDPSDPMPHLLFPSRSSYPPQYNLSRATAIQTARSPAPASTISATTASSATIGPTTTKFGTPTTRMTATEAGRPGRTVEGTCTGHPHLDLSQPGTGVRRIRADSCEARGPTLVRPPIPSSLLSWQALLVFADLHQRPQLRLVSEIRPRPQRLADSTLFHQLERPEVGQGTALAGTAGTLFHAAGTSGITAMPRCASGS